MNFWSHETGMDAPGSLHSISNDHTWGTGVVPHRWLSEHAAAQHEHPKLPKLFLFYEEVIKKGYFHGNWSSSARTQRAFISAFISHIKS